MIQEWKRLEDYLQQHLPEAYADLRPGATVDQVQEAEHTLGLRLPTAYRDSVQRHDGQDGRGPGVIGNWRLLPIVETIREWKLWRELLQMDSFQGYDIQSHPCVRRDAWNLAWIPVTVDARGNHHCLDLDPTPSGQVGQIIVVYAQEDRRDLISPDFQSWLQHLLRHLEAGNYPLLYDEGGVRFANDGFLQAVTLLR